VVALAAGPSEQGPAALAGVLAGRAVALVYWLLAAGAAAIART